jgi:hypothetical protein
MANGSTQQQWERMEDGIWDGGLESLGKLRDGKTAKQIQEEALAKLGVKKNETGASSIGQTSQGMKPDGGLTRAHKAKAWQAAGRLDKP